MEISRVADFAKLAVVVVFMLGCLGMATGAEPLSPSQLLEKAIYSEETKGDLDGAMTLYKQVVVEAKNTESVAAQAQYRLGLCYYKKNLFAQATTAFEKLVNDYPHQTNLVNLAQEYLAGAVSLLPAPWADGEELVMDVKFPTGFKLGKGNYCVQSGERDGQKIWKLSAQLFAGVRQCSQCEVVADSFKPMHTRWMHTLIGDAECNYSPGKVTVTMKQKKEPTEIELKNGVYYDNEECIQLLRRLPLATNYCTSIKIVSGLGGSTIGLGAKVTAIETVKVPAGTFECFKVELSVKQNFWYSTNAHRYLVKFEGGGVVAELTEINVRKPGESVAWHDADLGLSLSAPSGYLFDRHEPSGHQSGTKVFILDPNGIGMTVLTSEKISEIPDEQKKSLRTWADARVAEDAKSLKDLAVRADSWKDLTVAGKPALRALLDFTEGGQKKSGVVVYVMGEKSALEFAAWASASDFAIVQNDMDKIVSSLQFN